MAVAFWLVFLVLHLPVLWSIFYPAATWIILRKCKSNHVILQLKMVSRNINNKSRCITLACKALNTWPMICVCNLISCYSLISDHTSLLMFSKYAMSIPITGPLHLFLFLSGISSPRHLQGLLPPCKQVSVQISLSISLLYRPASMLYFF